MPMNIHTEPKIAVIFGGSGFIGSHLISELFQAGYEVHVADLIPPQDTNISFHECDVRKEIAIILERSPEIVINLSAVHRTPGHEIDEYYETNVKGAINIVNWSVLAGVQKIVFTSSISVYGPGDDLKDESSELLPVHAYGHSKIMAEDIFRTWQVENVDNRSLIICRPAVIFGPGENGNFTRLAKALKYKYFFYPGGKETVKACGYVKDLVKSIRFMLENTTLKSTTYNFCYPDNYTIGQICEAFEKVAGYAKPLSLPIARMGQFFSCIPGPFKLLGGRILKLVRSTKISPTVLLSLNFKWESTLDSALEEWKSESRKARNFA